jgi:hypothetical protein
LLLCGCVFRTRQQFVNHAVLLGALGIQVEVAIEVVGDFLDRLAGVRCDDVADDFVVAKDLLRRDFDIRCLPAGTAERLVHVHRRIGQSEPLALRARAKQHGSH